MTKPIESFTLEQSVLLKRTAAKLFLCLKNSDNPMANSFLHGELGKILNQVISEDKVFPFKDIPYFELMTRDYFAEIEIEYFNFYSMACFGELAYN
jgi:hypothetical protein